MRLVLIAHRFQPNDGQGRVNFEVARGAAGHGHTVTLLTAHCDPALAALPGVTRVLLGADWLPTQLLRDLVFACATTLWLSRRRGHVDLVQANGFTTFAAADIVTAHFVHSAWARSRWFPFRGSRSPRALYQRLFTWVNARAERHVFGRARRVIAVSDAVAADVCALGVPRRNVQVILNGVDLAAFHPGLAERISFGLPQHVPLAVFVGDIRTTRKNLDTVLHALRQVPALHLAVAGDTRGSLFPALAAQLGLAGRVHFLGKTTRIASLMRSADLFVFPSRYEAHPLVVLEAMASALPIVIASTVGSVASFAECFAVLEDPDDAAALTAMLQQLCDSPVQRRALGEAARSRALTLTWQRTVEAYLDSYEATLRSMPTPPPALKPSLGMRMEPR